MEVNVINRQKSLKISIDQVQRLVKHVIEEEERTCDEVNIYFVDITTISQLHEQFFNDPSPTDCISFPMDEEEEESPYHVLGEVFVCPAVALAYAAQHELDPYEETTLYIVHGLLHLMGYDDLTEKDRRKMRQAETRLLKSLKNQSLGVSAK